MAPQLDVPDEITASVGDSVSVFIKGRRITTLTLVKSILPDGTTKAYGIPDGFTRQNDAVNHTITISGVPTVEGDYKFVVRLTGLGGEKVEKTLTLHATAASGISIPTTSLSSPRKLLKNGHIIIEKSGQRYTVDGRRTE